jgi:hypothetical protein
VFSYLQNAKCQLIWNNKMQNAKIFMGVFSSIQNANFFYEVGEGFLDFWLFFCSLEAKI